MTQVFVPIVIIMGFVSRNMGENGAHAFQYCAAWGGMLLMTKSLSFMRLMNMKLATFVLAIQIIITDIRSFFMVFTLVLLGFSFAFFTIINDDSLSLHDDEQENVRRAAAAASALVLSANLTPAAQRASLSQL